MLKLCVEKRLILQSKIENKSFQGNVKATFSHLRTCILPHRRVGGGILPRGI